MVKMANYEVRWGNSYRKSPYILPILALSMFIPIIGGRRITPMRIGFSSNDNFVFYFVGLIWLIFYHIVLIAWLKEKQVAVTVCPYAKAPR